MNKNFVKSILLAASVLSLGSFSAPSVSDAAEVLNSSPQPDARKNVKTDNSSIKAEVIDEVLFYPMDAIYLSNVHHTGYTAYTGEFTSHASNGKSLNVWVRNAASTPVYVTISRNGGAIIENYALSGRDQKTFTLMEQVAAGINGDFKIYVYNSNGARYSVFANARQY